MDALRILSGFLLVLAGWMVPAFSQNPAAPKNPPVFAVLNLIRANGPSVLKIGAEPVGEGQMALGYYSGVLHWVPAAPLLVESPGFSPLRIPPAKAGSGECPLYILQDALEKPAGGGEPKPILKWTEVANAKDRPACFFDGLNLTSRGSLVGNLEGREVVLEKGKRTRLTTKNGFRMQIREGPEISLGPYEENPGGMLLVFFENSGGGIEHVITYDLIQP